MLQNYGGSCTNATSICELSTTAANNQQPATYSQHSTTNSQQPTIDNQKPTTANRQPTANNRQLITNNPKPATNKHALHTYMCKMLRKTSELKHYTLRTLHCLLNGTVYRYVGRTNNPTIETSLSLVQKQKTLLRTPVLTKPALIINTSPPDAF